MGGSPQVEGQCFSGPHILNDKTVLYEIMLTFSKMDLKQSC